VARRAAPDLERLLGGVLEHLSHDDRS